MQIGASLAFFSLLGGGGKKLRIGMLKNYFKTALRNLAKSKMHSIINITGLSVGMAVAMLIGLWIYDEVSFDQNFEHKDRIALVVQNVTNNGEVSTWKAVPVPLGDVLRKEYGSNFSRVVRSVVQDPTVTESCWASTDTMFARTIRASITLKYGSRRSMAA